MPFCECGNINLYYQQTGQGVPVIFISGLGGGSWSWSKQVPFFDKSYQCIVFDNRGAGQSNAPPGPYTMEEMALDTVHLLHSLEIKKTLVVGISMGGMIAQELALLLPHRIMGMVLASTHPGGSLHIPPDPEVYARLTDNEGLNPEEIVDKNISILFGQKTRQEQPELIEEYKQDQLQLPEQEEYAFKAQDQAIRNFDCSDRLSKISVPVLAMTGTDDNLIPPENSKILAEHIPQASLIQLDGAGHLIHMEKTEIFNQEVDAFFQNHIK